MSRCLHDDESSLHGIAAVLRATTRLLLWLTIALPVAYVVMWLTERLLFAGLIGIGLVMSGSFQVLVVTVALAIGNLAAYGCDRVFVRRRDRSRGLGRGRPGQGHASLRRG